MGSHRNGVDEVAAHLRKAKLRPPGGKEADQQIALIRITIQKNLIRGQQDVVQSRLAALRNAPQSLDKFAVQLNDNRASPARQVRRSGMVGRQVQNMGRAPQLFLPVRQNRGALRSLDLLRLPVHEFSIFLFHGPERGPLAGRQRGITVLQFGQEVEHRRPVECDVMKIKQQGVAIVAIGVEMRSQ